MANAKRKPAAEPVPQPAGSVIPLPTVKPWQSLDKVKRKKVTWLWPGRILNGMLTVLEGRKSVGKSTILATICAAMTGGPPLPGMARKRSKGAVMWLSGEEEVASLVLPRLQGVGANVSQIYCPAENQDTGLTRRIYLPNDLSELDMQAEICAARILVMDPWTSFVHPSIELHNDAAVRSVLEPLADWAAKRGITVLMTRHLRKGTGGPAIDQGLGSVGVGNVARTVMRLDRHPNERGLFTVATVACNLVNESETLTYRFEEVEGAVRIKWEGQTAMSADALAEANGDSGERDARADAVRLLVALIADRWRAAREVLAEARDAGVSERTLRSAKAELGVQSRRNVAGTTAFWEWGPPAKGWVSA